MSRLTGIWRQCGIVTFLMAGWFSAAVYAQSADLGHIRVVRYADRYHLNPDGTFVRTLSETKRAMTSAAVDALGRQSFSYNTRLETFRLVSAATLKADGTRIDIAPEDVQTQAGMLSSGMDPSMQDYAMVVVTFPRLARGDSVTYTVQLTQTEAELKGHFDVLKTFSRAMVVDDAEIDIDAPQAMHLQVDSARVAPDPVQRQGGREIFRWHYSRDHVDEEEPYGADSRLADPYIEASNYADYAAIGAAYYAQAKTQARATPAVVKLAFELTQDASSPLEQAHRLYDFVRTNIRYVATYIGAGGWVPHDAEWTLAHRYGDCKDHVTLLAALLAARGIDSEAVLINADLASFTLPRVPVRAFNHAITYLPQWHLYLDSTDHLAPFGVLPEADSGRPVLHAAALSYVAQTSLPRAADHAVTRQVNVQIAADGSATVDVSVTGSGVSALQMRNGWQAVGQGGESRWLKDVLHSDGFEGTGSVHFEDDGDQATLTARFQIAEYLRNTDAGAISADTFLPSPVTFAALLSVFRPSTRALPYECYPSAIHDTIRYQLPSTLKILSVPKPVRVAVDGFDYRAESSLDGQVYELRQDFSENRSKGRCEADQYTAQRAAVMQIKRNVMAQLLYAAR